MRTNARAAAPVVLEKRRRLPAAERRAEVLAAARSVFARKGFEGARMREIAQEAGANVATLFQHFDSKEDMFEAAVLQPLERFVDVHQENAVQFAAGDPEQRWSQAVEHYKVRLTLMMEGFPLLVAALFASHDRGSAFYQTVLYPKILQLSALNHMGLPELKQHGIDPLFMAISTFGMDFMLAMDAHFREVEPDIEGAATGFVNMVRASVAEEGAADASRPSIADVEGLTARIAALEKENRTLRQAAGIGG